MNEEFIDWLKNFVELHKDSDFGDDVLEDMARGLCDDIPLGYEASLRLASILFSHVNNTKQNEI